jgi:hypothetical protein
LNSFYLIPWKEVAQDIKSRLNEGDLVLTSDLSIKYYLQKEGISQNVMILPGGDNINIINNINRNRRLWVLFPAKDNLESFQLDKRNLNILTESFSLIDAFNYCEIDKAYISIKKKLQGAEPYRYKLTVRLYEKSRF